LTDWLYAEETGVISVDSLRNTLGPDIPQHILVAMIRPLELKAGSDGITIDHFMDHWIAETSAWYVNPSTVMLSGRKHNAPVSSSGSNEDSTGKAKSTDSSEWDGRQKLVKFAPESKNITTCYSPESRDSYHSPEKVGANGGMSAMSGSTDNGEMKVEA
jgi:hypothetical protein